MPTRAVFNAKGKIIGYRWGHQKIYHRAKYSLLGAKALADRQGRAVFASGYRGK